MLKVYLCMICCPTCYEVCDKIPECIETLRVVTSVQNDTVKLIIKDKFGIIYEIEGDTDRYGIIEIETEDLPEKLFNRYAGQFMLTLKQAGEIVPFIIDGTSYECLLVEFGNVTPIPEDYLLDVYGL